MVRVKKEDEGGNVTLECSAPILRSLMLHSVILPSNIRLSTPVPDKDHLDPWWLLARTVENLCLWHLRSRQSLNADGNPSEYAFQSEFSTIFRHLVPLLYPELQYEVLVEVKERDESNQRKQRLDILVRDVEPLPAYGFELVVAASETSFDEHCER
ncbi:hypothetical protein BGX27_003672, partial [Mortierella sp. AM989]